MTIGFILDWININAIKKYVGGGENLESRVDSKFNLGILFMSYLLDSQVMPNSIYLET